MRPAPHYNNNSANAANINMSLRAPAEPTGASWLSLAALKFIIHQRRRESSACAREPL